MKKMFVIFAALLAVRGAQASFTSSCVDPCNDKKAWICHGTSSSSNPFTLNHVSVNAGPQQPAFQGHLAHVKDVCATIVGSCDLTKNGAKVYENMQITCPTTPPTPTPFNIGCEGGNCETSLNNSASFDFHVQSGGINQDLYVCEVGFRANTCLTCNATDDKIVVNFKNGDKEPVVITYPNFQTFGMRPQAINADVFLNSLDYSAGWYVRYCLKTTRLVVGDIESSNLAATITGLATVDSTHDNGYLEKAGLQFGVTHECNDEGEVFAPVEGDLDLTPHGVHLISSDESVKINTEDFLCLSGTGCRKQMCNWVINFQETACTIRKIKHVDCKDGELVCRPYKANIHTTLDVTTDFTCVTGDCQ